MNTFLKVLVVAVAVIVAIKLLPITLLVGCIIGGAALVMTVVGLSAVAIIVAVALALLAALSPVWLPVLAIVGIIALVRRSSRKPAQGA